MCARVLSHLSHSRIDWYRANPVAPILPHTIMDWPLDDPAFYDEDFDGVFLYQPGRSKAVYRFEGDTVRAQRK